MTAAVRVLVIGVRRELWEHPWLYRVLAGVGLPLIVLAIVIPPEPARAAGAFEVAARMILVTTFIVAFFYCADALHGERRDRSILFWKSLPVSDGAAVAAKIAVAMVVLPALAFALVLVCQAAAAVLRPDAALRGPLMRPWPAAGEVMTTALLQAPLYCWVLLVSAWARRAAMLWALLPAGVAFAFEIMIDRGASISAALFQRGLGRHLPVAHSPFDSLPDGMSDLPAREAITSPSLWLGLAVALLLAGLATWLRRRQSAL